MRLEIFGQPHNLLSAFAQKDLEQVEDDSALVAAGLYCRKNLLVEQLEARTAEHVIRPCTQPLAKGGENSASASATTRVPRKSRQKPKHPTTRCVLAEVSSRCIFEMMTFIDDEPAVRGNHGSLIPILLHASHRDIRHQQMMICDDDLSGCGFLPRAEEEALVEMRTFCARAEI